MHDKNSYLLLMANFATSISIMMRLEVPGVSQYLQQLYRKVSFSFTIYDLLIQLHIRRELFVFLGLTLAVTDAYFFIYNSNK